MANPVSDISEPWWRFIRRAELDAVKKYFPDDKDARILEIGGMDGYQAKTIADMGYRNITSIDITPLSPQLFPVQQTTGANLDFESGSFDAVYSSHVVAHIRDIDESLREMHRVTEDDATFIHIVPTTTWTVITNIFYFIRLGLSLPGRVGRLLFARSDSSPTGTQEENVAEESSDPPKSKMQKLKYMLLNPLGENPSFVHELYRFSRSGWRRFFAKHGFQTVHVADGPYFYSTYGVFRDRFMVARSFLARIGFAGCRCFVLKKGVSNQ